MHLGFLGQPYEDAGNLYDFLEEVLRDRDTQEFTAVVAWAKRSGLGRIADFLTDFRERGARARIVLGIDEFGGTIQGLRMAVDLFDDPYVLHDTGAGTFHPKIYVARTPDAGRVLVGSNNLTAGGLFKNYEASVQCMLNFEDEDDAAFYDAADAYIQRLIQDTEICRPLTIDLVEDLIADERYHIRDEDYRPSDRDAIFDSPPEDEDDEEIPPLFGNSKHTKRRGPRNPARFAPKPLSPARPARPRLVPIPEPSESDEVVRRRFKGPLKHTDAQIPIRVGSHVTGNLRLAQAGHSIDQTTYFRSIFFEGATWATEPGPRGDLEVATIPFEIEIDGANYGAVGLRVDHAEYRIAGQRNTPSVLKWGEEVGPLLRSRPYTGRDYVVIERLSDGRYRLRITQNPGPFVA